MGSPKLVPLILGNPHNVVFDELALPGRIRSTLEGQGDLVSRLKVGILGVTIWVIGVMNLLTKSP